MYIASCCHCYWVLTPSELQTTVSIATLLPSSVSLCYSAINVRSLSLLLQGKLVSVWELLNSTVCSRRKQNINGNHYQAECGSFLCDSTWIILRFKIVVIAVLHTASGDSSPALHVAVSVSFLSMTLMSWVAQKNFPFGSSSPKTTGCPFAWRKYFRVPIHKMSNSFYSNSCDQRTFFWLAQTADLDL